MKRQLKGASKMNKQEMIQKLSESDNFPVDWATRNENGDFVLTSDVFRVTVTPAPLFGYNVRDFGLDYANEQAEKFEAINEHDFGACYVRDKSLRKLDDGRWYIDLTVDPSKCRFHRVTKIRLKTDDEGNILCDESGVPIPMLDDEGNPIVTNPVQKESFITVALDMIEPDTSHDLAAPYVQTDSRNKAKIRLAERSAKAANRKKGSGGKKGKSARLSQADYAAAMAKATAGASAAE